MHPFHLHMYFILFVYLSSSLAGNTLKHNSIICWNEKVKEMLLINSRQSELSLSHIKINRWQILHHHCTCKVSVTTIIITNTAVGMSSLGYIAPESRLWSDLPTMQEFKSSCRFHYKRNVDTRTIKYEASSIHWNTRHYQCSKLELCWKRI